MPLLETLLQDRLTPARLWSELDLDTKMLAARSLYEYDWEGSPTKLEANMAIAATLRFREIAVRKLPLDKRVRYLAQSVRPDESLSSSLLMALHMTHRRNVLTLFLDTLELPHDNGVIDDDHELQPMPADRLRPAVARLREQFERDQVDVYLATLLALDPQIWGALAEVGARAE